MSTGLAIAAVTGVLRNLLHGGLTHRDPSTVGVGDFSVISEPPDRIPTGSSTELTRLNVFLYHVSPNPGWRNVGLPSRDGRGGNLSNPPLALDLHYLLTAYGRAAFNAEILLGYAMQVLHETPVLTRQEIRRAFESSAYRLLAASNLAEQVEQIKISPQPLSSEEMSKLWTAFQAHYRPTAAYHASVVLIESARPIQTALPVRRAKVYALPFAQPFIEEVSSDSEVDPRITGASRLVLTGRGLQGQVTRVRIGDILAPPPDLDVSATRIALPLASLATLRAGVLSVQVVHEILLGEPEEPHRGVESNAAAFVLHPTVTRVEPSGVTGTTAGGVTLLSATIAVTLTPQVGRAQRVRLLLNEAEDPPADRPARAYSVAAPRDNGLGRPDSSGRPTDTPEIRFEVRGVFPGRYLVRVQVDGAESLLREEGRDGTGRYVGPTVEIRTP